MRRWGHVVKCAALQRQSSGALFAGCLCPWAGVMRIEQQRVSQWRRHSSSDTGTVVGRRVGEIEAARKRGQQQLCRQRFFSLCFGRAVYYG